MKGESPLAIFYNHTLKSLWISSNIQKLDSQKTATPRGRYDTISNLFDFNLMWKNTKMLTSLLNWTRSQHWFSRFFFHQIINFLTDFELHFLRRWKRERGEGLSMILKLKYSSCLKIFMQKKKLIWKELMKNLFEEIINISISLLECMTEIPWPLADIHRSIGASQLTWKLNKYGLTIPS